MKSVGTWRSLVAHSLGVRGVGSSNLPVPTIDFTHSVQELSGVSILHFDSGRLGQ
jgi:hypothetical protein